MVDEIDPKHQGSRGILRVLGPILLVLGLALIVGGACKMFGSFSVPDVSMNQDFDSSSRQMSDSFTRTVGGMFGGFGLIAFGMLCAVAGAVLTWLGYMGSVARYASQEITPVATDTINYAVQHTQNSLQTVAKAVTTGIAQGARQAGGQQEPSAAPPLRCAKCGSENLADAKFCNQCGDTLAQERICPSCGKHNAAGAKFCEQCGRAI